LQYNEYASSQAPTEFYNWITSTQTIRTNVNLFGEASEFLKSAHERVRILESVAAQIEGQSRNKLPLLISIYQKGMWGGLRAFAGELTKKVFKNRTTGYQLPVFYATFSRNRKPHSVLTLPRLVAYLDAFFANKPFIEAKTPETSSEIEASIARIRRSMTRTPAVLIFDGYTEVTSPLPALISAIRDDYLPRLIDYLGHPPPDGDPMSLDLFSQNRIVILSDAPLGWRSVCESIRLELPFPNVEDIEKVIALQRLIRPHNVIQLRNERFNIWNVKSELVFQLIDGAIAIESALLHQTFSAIAEDIAFLARGHDLDSEWREHLVRKILQVLLDKSPTGFSVS
jgi:hypothetical protein